MQDAFYDVMQVPMYFPGHGHMYELQAKFTFLVVFSVWFGFMLHIIEGAMTRKG